MNIFKKLSEKRKEKKAKKARTASPSCAAVIVAAGSSSRMNGIDKLFADLGGKPVLAHTLLAYENCPNVSEIILVTSEANIIKVGDVCREYGIYKLKKIVCGGEMRSISVQNGLAEVSDKNGLVAIHDGARPLVTNELIVSTVKAAERFSAAAPVIPLTDTVKVVADGMIISTPDRSKLFAVQTPQIFNVSLIRGALSSAAKNGAVLTDDCSAVELIGGKVCTVDGSPDNIKITYPSDLVKARAILEARRETESCE